MVWDPFEEISRMHEEIDKMYSRIFRSGWPRETPLLGGKGQKELAPYSDFRMPAVDMQETDSSVVAQFELPGVDKNEIELNVTDDSVEVKVQKKSEKEQKKEGVYSYESRAQQFYRRLALPAEVDSDKAQAEYKDGVLRVEVPKLKRVAEKKKRIKIN